MKFKNKKLIIFFVILFGIFILFIFIFKKDEEAEKIKKILKEMEIALEKGDRNSLAMHVAKDYLDNYGHNNESVVSDVMRRSAKYKDLDLEIYNLDIDIKKNKREAIAEFQVILKNARGEKIQIKEPDIPDGEERRKIIIHFLKYTDTWKVRKGEVAYKIFYLH